MLTFTVPLPAVKLRRQRVAALAFFERLEERMRALPGVTKAGLISCAPVSNCHWGTFYHAEGAPPRGPNDPNPVVLNRVASPEYFERDGHPAEGRRFFTEQDGRDGSDQDSVIIVNETLCEDVVAGRRQSPSASASAGTAPRRRRGSPWSASSPT